jgi:uncharacterized protein (TIGR02271 family)
MTQTVVGLFDNASEAQQAVQELLSSGFTNANIDISSVASGTTSGSTDLSSGTSGTSGTFGTSGTSGISGTSGTFGTSGTHENESGISRFFKNLFGDDDNDADKYSKVAARSNSIVTVYAQTADEAERAADILDDNGAVNVDEKGNEYGYGSSTGSTGSSYGNSSDLGTTTGTVGMGSSVLGSVDMGTTTGNTYDNTTSGDTFDTNRDTTDVNKSIPIIEENLEVGKRTVQTGGVRLRSRIVARPVEETLRLREERVSIERNTVDRPATEADFTAFKEGEVEMIERAEVPVVSKQARVVEEVSLGKEVNERTETINETVRKTEVDVENIEGKTNTSSTSSTDFSKE